MRAKRGAIVVGLVAGTVLAGCAVDSPIIENILVVPSYYDTLSCTELVGQVRAAEGRIKELSGLMEKSSSSAGGPVVNALAYNTDYAKARATQKYAEDAARRKSCDFTKKVEPTAAPAASPLANPIDLGMPKPPGR